MVLGTRYRHEPVKSLRENGPFFLGEYPSLSFQNQVTHTLITLKYTLVDMRKLIEISVNNIRL